MGAFSQRDMVGWEAEVVSTFWQSSTGQFESGVLAQIIQIIGIRVAASDGEDPGTQDVRHRMCAQVGVAMVGDDRSQCVDQAKSSVGTCQSKTPPSELIRPPSNAAVTFFLADAWQREW